MEEIFIHMRNVVADYFLHKICFVTIYVFLSQNMFSRDSRAFAWRKVKSKFVPVEKKGQISGMGVITQLLPILVFFICLVKVGHLKYAFEGRD